MASAELVLVVEEAPDGGYGARAVGESIVTEADDLDALRDMVRDAVAFHFDEDERPKVVRLPRA
ncbi:MAG: 2-oxoisovalerate dehydrogenase E1 subunit beta [Acidimicrobiales bacterium]